MNVLIFTMSSTCVKPEGSSSVASMFIFSVNKAANTSHQQDSTDYAAFDRFRSRVGSIVRPSGAPLLTPRTSLEQQTCKWF